MTDPTGAADVGAAMRHVVEMVGELHRRGYGLLRCEFGLAPTGLHWRCSIGAPGTTEAARYTSGSGTAYFGWTDAHDASPAMLADLFVARLPALAAAGKGVDREYAAWFALVLAAARDGWFPTFHADHELDWSAGVPLVGTEPSGPRPTLPPPPAGG
jgi:hypothetical protein